MLTKSAADIRFQLSECSILRLAPYLVSPQYAGTRPIAWNRRCTMNRMFSAPKFRSIFQVSTRSMVPPILRTRSHLCVLVDVTNRPGPACDGLGQSVTRQSRDSSLDLAAGSAPAHSMSRLGGTALLLVTVPDCVPPVRQARAASQAARRPVTAPRRPGRSQAGRVVLCGTER
jgi:hypothetical protein